MSEFVTKTLSSIMSLAPRVPSYFRSYGISATLKRIIIELHRKNIGTNIYTSGVEWKNLFEINPEVIVVSNDYMSPSHLYRVENVIASIWKLGLSAVWLNRSTFKELDAIPRNTKYVILWRTSESLDSYPIYRSNVSKIKFIYDVDDLTFDQNAYTIENVFGLSRIPKSSAKKLTTDVLQRQRELIASVDAFTAPTNEILTSASNINSSVHLWPNVISFRDFEKSNQLLKSKISKETSKLIIGYASGTPTHDDDFAVILGALQKLLSKNNNIHLVLLGYIEVPNKLKTYMNSGQVKCLPIVKADRLLDTISDWDINLAPLRLPNRFNDAKSELKWIHASALAIPTIASPSRSYLEIIEDGVDGFIARNEDEWLDRLEILTTKNTREEMGLRARDKVIEHRTLKNLSKSIEDTFNFLNDTKSDSPHPEISQIAFVLPDLPSGSGGHRNIFRLANSAGKLGFFVFVVITNTNLSMSKIDDFAREHYLDGKFIVTSDLSILPKMDFVVATHYSTVSIVTSRSSKAATLGYIVQDFEPWFFPMSQEYLVALDTYLLHELNVLCSGRWMADKVKKISGRVVPYFDFPLNREVYFPSEDFRRGVLFFAKPDTPRRLFNLGLDSIRLARKVLGDFPVYIYGSDDGSLKNLEGEFSLIGKVPSLPEVANLYRSCMVGLAFSTSNPSLVPVEMSACGLPVVDVLNEATRDFYPDWMQRHTLANVDARDVAGKLIKLLTDDELWKEASLEGLAFSNMFPNEIELDRIVENWIKNAK